MLVLRRSSLPALSAALLLASRPMAAQELLASVERPVSPTRAQVVTADSAPPAVPAKKAPSTSHSFGFTLSGYVETAYNHAYHGAGAEIAGRLYEKTNDALAFNAIKLTLDRPADPMHFAVGFHTDLLLGQNARAVKSFGFDAGRDRDIYQFYGTLNIPTPDHNGLQVKVGRMSTFLGLEVIESPLNANVSIGNAFAFAENSTQTGVSVEHRFNSHVDAQFRVSNGWDQVRDVNSRASYMARVGVSPDANTSLALAAYAGPEQANNNAALRSGLELLASHKVGTVTTFVQGDFGQEQRNDALADPTRDASWWAASTWVVVEHSPRVGFALRADVMNDRVAARTSGAFGLVDVPGNRLASATGTLNLHATRHVLLRPELRFDRSSNAVFGGRQNQSTLGLSAAYIF